MKLIDSALKEEIRVAIRLPIESVERFLESDIDVFAWLTQFTFGDRGDDSIEPDRIYSRFYQVEEVGDVETLQRKRHFLTRIYNNVHTFLLYFYFRKD